MTARDPLPFLPAGDDVATPEAPPAPAAEQTPLFYGPPPSARPLRLVRRTGETIETGRPLDRVRHRDDGSTVACRVQRAPAWAPAVWMVRLVVTTRGQNARPHGRTLYAPTLSAALTAQAAAMDAFAAAADAAADYDRPTLAILAPDDDTPRPVQPRRGPDGSGAPTVAAG